jgi:hypothetical protein
VSEVKPVCPCLVVWVTLVSFSTRTPHATFTLPLTRSLTYSLTHSLTHLTRLTHSLTSLTSLAHPLARSLTHVGLVVDQAKFDLFHGYCEPLKAPTFYPTYKKYERCVVVVA